MYFYSIRSKHVSYLKLGLQLDLKLEIQLLEFMSLFRQYVNPMSWIWLSNPSYLAYHHTRIDNYRLITGQIRP
jgi:hypothetical protein